MRHEKNSVVYFTRKFPPISAEISAEHNYFGEQHFKIKKNFKELKKITYRSAAFQGTQGRHEEAL
jgi:hypothetical protein